MKTSKKLVCFLCCLVVLFTCASVSWSPHVDAAMPVASYVASVVGSFILSAGFSFDNRGDFQSATEAFLESDVARGITEITTHIGNICALGNMSEPLLIHELINAGFFKDFWNSIYEFFGNGEITIETGESIPDPKEGFAFYNNYELPIIPSGNYSKYYIFYYHINDNGNSGAYLYTLINTDLDLKVFKSSGVLTNYSASGKYTYWQLRADFTGGWKNKTDKSGSLTTNSWKVSDVEVIWSSNSEFYNTDGSVFLYSSPAITEGQENYDVIGVYNNEVHSAEDIIASWTRAAENGGSIDWALDSIPAYQDITSSDKDVPVTQTQSGVLTQSGVKVQTDEEVKEEVKQEAIKELGNYTVTGLASIFPFCIPFDIYNFFAVLTAEREAPVFDFPLNFGKLGSHNIHVDLSGWDTVAQILRTIELLAFCVALAWGTSKLIKW